EGRRRGQDWSRLLWAFDNPVKDDEEREAQVFDLRLRSGAATINEYRTHLGYSAVPWGDEPWLPGSLVQPSQADEEPRDNGLLPDEPEGVRGEARAPTRKRRTLAAWYRVLKAKRRRDRKRPDGGGPEKPPKEKPPKKPKDKTPKKDPKRKPRRYDKPTSSAAGDVIIVEPAGGHGNRYHLAHGGEFTSPSGGSGHVQDRNNSAATGTQASAQTGPYFVFNKTHKASQPSPKGVSTNGNRLQSHHLLQDKWARVNLARYKYDPELAPTITLENGKGLPHTMISTLQKRRRRERLAKGQKPWSSTINEELGHIVSDLRAVGLKDTEVGEALDLTCRMLDKLGVKYTRPKEF
ncbi:MAG: hypothetical protein P4L84_34035, partial [Isosphaeraceae bacterium]|nr:hypothetical protein [Isosphaeraceae bacterium]